MSVKRKVTVPVGSSVIVNALSSWVECPPTPAGERRPHDSHRGTRSEAGLTRLTPPAESEQENVVVAQGRAADEHRTGLRLVERKPREVGRRAGDVVVNAGDLACQLRRSGGERRPRTVVQRYGLKFSRA